MKNRTFSKLGPAGRSTYAKSIIAFLLILHCFFYSFAQTDPDNYVWRNGNDMDFHFYCNDENGNRHKLVLEWRFNDYEGCQQTYRRLDHHWQANPYDKFYYKDPYADAIRTIAGGLRDIAYKEGLPVLDVLVSFVQSLEYDDVAENYCRYTFEGFLDGKKMCAEGSFLLSTLLRNCGYDAVLLEFKNEHHMAVGIAHRYDGPKFSGYYYSYNNTDYYYVETTSIRAIGSVPPGDFSTANVMTVYPH